MGKQTRASRRPSKPHPRPQALTPPTKGKMKSTTLAVGLAVALAVAAVSTCQAEKEETYLEAATHFCETMTPEEDHCGWVGVKAKEDASGVYDSRYQNDREVAINEINCPQRGTVWGGWYEEKEAGTGGSVRYPPNAIIGPGINGASYFQLFPRYLSLGCREKKVEVQAVYKLINPEQYASEIGPGPYYAGLDLTMGGPWYPQNLTRCSLGSGPAPGNLLTDCRECQQNASGEGACPIEEGVWYEDTMILDMPEQCPPSPDGPVMPSIYVNPFQTLNVSAFTATPMT